MFFAAVASNGKGMPPHFIEAGLKISTEDYLKILIVVFLLWTRENYDHNQVILILDSAQARGAKKVQTYLKENILMFVTKKFWPSSLLDLNVRDFWVDSLKAAIR